MPPQTRSVALPKLRKDGTRRRRASPSAVQMVENGRAFIKDMDARGIKTIKVGRPRSYGPDCCDIALDVASRGGSIAAIAVALGCSRDVLHSWRTDFPEFNDAMSRARDAAQEWWEAHGRKNLKSKHYQANVWAKSMSARFPEYREVKQASVGEMAVDLLAAIEEVARKLAPGGEPGDGAKLVGNGVAKDDASEDTP